MAWSHISLIEGQQRCNEVSIIREISRLVNFISQFTSNTIKDCIIRCIMTKRCKSINFNADKSVCGMNNTETGTIEPRKNGSAGADLRFF